MEFGLVVYLLIAAIAISMPILGVMDHRRMLRRVEAKEPDARVSTYRLTIAFQWGTTAIVLLVWLGTSQNLSSLGLGFQSGWGFWVFGGLTLVACLLSVVQAVTVTRSEEKLAQAKDQFRSLIHLVPHDNRDAQWWTGLSITAGICEEIIYRGFMITVIAASVGTWVAVGVSAVVFGLGHAYQGPSSILKTAAIGVAMGVLFVVTGSLWAPMLLHVVYDLTIGYIGWQVVTRTNVASPTAA